MQKVSFKRSAISVLICTLFGVQTDVARSAETGNVHLDAINVTAAYEQGFTGEGVRIGILDSGFDIDHEAFADKDIINIASEHYEQTYGTDPKWEIGRASCRERV